MKISRAISGFLLSLAFLISFAYILAGLQYIFDNSSKSKVFLGSVSDSMQNNLPDGLPEDNNQTPFVLGINAKSAISVESNLQVVNKIIFEKDSNVQLPIASLTKLMTAVIVLENYNLTDTVTVSSIADSQDAMKQDVKFGDTFTVENFLDIMLISSSNRSAYALSEVIGEKRFVELMNQKAKDLGLENTVFADPTGLSSADVSTAYDLSKLAQYILKNYPRIADVSKEKQLFIPGFGTVETTNQLIGQIPDIVCGKTGFTTDANGCLLLVINNQKNNDYLINVVLGADDRFSEMQKLINWSSVICK